MFQFVVFMDALFTISWNLSQQTAIHISVCVHTCVRVCMSMCIIEGSLCLFYCLVVMASDWLINLFRLQISKESSTGDDDSKVKKIEIKI